MADYETVKAAGVTALASADALKSQVQSNNLDGKLRGDLAAMNVHNRGKQDIIIAASMGELKPTYDENHKPIGDFSATLKTKVEILGLGQAPSTGSDAGGQAPQLKPAPITNPATGPMTYEERQAQGASTLARVRAGHTE